MGYGHDAASRRNLLELEFNTLIDPTFYLLLSPEEHVVGYLAIDRIRSDHEENDPFWPLMLATFPGLASIYLADRYLQCMIVSGIVIDRAHRGEQTALHLMEYMMRQNGPETDIIIGLTKNPAAIHLRREVIERHNANNPQESFVLYVGARPFPTESHLADESHAPHIQTLMGMYAAYALSGYAHPDFPGVFVIPKTPQGQSYLPVGHQKPLVELPARDQEVLSPLYQAQASLTHGEVAVLSLVAINRMLLDAMSAEAVGDTA